MENRQHFELLHRIFNFLYQIVHLDLKVTDNKNEFLETWFICSWLIKQGFYDMLSINLNIPLLLYCCPTKRANLKPSCTRLTSQAVATWLKSDFD